MTTATPVPSLPAVRPGPGAWLTLTVAEAKMVSRDTAGLVVPLFMPVLILVMSAGQDGLDEAIPGTQGRTALDIHVLPLTIAFIVAMIGVVNMPSFLAAYRRTGVLRRLGVTPASPMMVLVAQSVVGVVQVVAGLVLTLGVAMVAFGAHLPVNIGVAAGVLALSVASCYALGMLVAAVAPTPQSAVALGLVAFLGMAALGGLFGGLSNLPSTVADIGTVLPFGAMVEGLGSAWAGSGVPLSAVAGLAVTTVVSGALAAVWFRWE